MLWKDSVNFIQPGVWLKRDKLLSCGGIDIQYHYSFDWDLYIRYLYFYNHVIELNDLLVHFRMHHLSKTTSYQDRFVNEQIQIAEKLASNSDLSKIHSICKKKYKKHNWVATVTHITNTTENSFVKIFKLIKFQCANLRFSSPLMTLGAIRRIIINKKYIS